MYLSPKAIKVAVLHQQGSKQADQLRELGAQHIELVIQQKFDAAVGGTVHTHRPEILKVDISKYIGVEYFSLLIWFVKLYRAVKECHIEDEHSKFTFAQTHVAGGAKAWVLWL